MVMDYIDNSDAAKIAIIGSGNVATHLARGFANAGCNIVQVYSKTYDHAQCLAKTLPSCEAIDNIDKLVKDADLYLIAVKDAAVSEVAEKMTKVNGIVAHTSGSVSMTKISSASERIAVLYPLQTFSRDVKLNMNEVPFFTEASDGDTLEAIDAYARKLSSSVYHANSSQRMTLHIAGVLSCNFVNYLWDRTAEVLARDGYEFKVVEPLIRITLDKALAVGPHKAQTGPAMRNDSQVMTQHMSKLDEDLAKLYGEISQAIIKSHRIDE